MINYLLLNKVKLEKQQLENLKYFIKMDFLPNDLRLSLLQDIMSGDNESVKQVVADAEISMLLLQNM
jgi:hypothetical protein